MADNSAVGYVEPTTWPNAGSLLRAPQTVCFSFCVYPDLHNIEPGLGYVYSTVMQGFDYFQVAIDTKIAIENLRPNRTSVAIAAYNTFTHTGTYAITYPQPSSYYNSYFDFHGIEGGTNYLPYVLAPDPAEEFFGLDWLHLVVANGAFFTFYQDWILFGTPIDLAKPTPFYDRGKVRVVNSHHKFSGFKVIMYGMPFLDISDEGLITMEPPEEPMNEVCTELAEYGYSYGGVANTEFTVANLTELIAGHFNFDPDTGKDLPSSS
jgi:hypothetical protein